MFDYHAANDETIIARSHDGDDAATDFLLEKYKPLVKKKARTLFLIGGDNDDLIQEGMIALYKAIRAFRADRESSFVHYASLCIDNQLYNIIIFFSTVKIDNTCFSDLLTNKKGYSII